MANFPNGRQEPLETVICKHCKKVILKRTAKDHVAGCLKSKQEKARKKKEAREAAQRAKERAERAEDDDDEDDDVNKDGGGSGTRKSAVNGDAADDGTKKGKKRKTDAEDDKEPPKKKKKKDEQKPKVPKPKGPVDVERQCGVTLPNGAQCARSLTCKSHSMGAKRAVPGRSLPYDMLLAAYQKKNQARQQSMPFTKMSCRGDRLTILFRGRHRRQRAGPVRRRTRPISRRTGRLGRRTRGGHDSNISESLPASAADHAPPFPDSAKVPTHSHERDAIQCAQR